MGLIAQYHQMTMRYPGRTRWLFFYIFVRFPLGIANISMMLMTSVFQTLAGNFFFSNQTDGLRRLVWIGIGSFLLIFQIFVFLDILQFLPKGYRKNFWLIALEAFVICLYLVDRAYQSMLTLDRAAPSSFPFLIGAIVFSLCWFLPNFFYFRKRRVIFGLPTLPRYRKAYGPIPYPGHHAPSRNNPSMMSPEYQTPANDVPASRCPLFTGTAICPHCGGMISEDKRFCDHCGKKIE